MAGRPRNQQVITCPFGQCGRPEIMGPVTRAIPGRGICRLPALGKKQKQISGFEMTSGDASVIRLACSLWS